MSGLNHPDEQAASQISALRLDLMSSTIKTSEKAAYLLSKLPCDEVVELLIEGLARSQSHVAVNSARSLGMIGQAANRGVTALVMAAFQSSIALRGEACAALGRIKSHPFMSVNTLAKALSDPEVSVRQYAAAAIAEFDDDAQEAIGELCNALKDEDPQVREFAIAALKNVSDLPLVAITDIRKSLKDNNYQVRVTASEIFVEHQLSQAGVA